MIGRVALVEGEPSEADVEMASRIVARYGKGREQPQVVVEWRRGDAVEREVTVAPFADDAAFDHMRI